MPAVSVLIVNYNAGPALRRCLAQLAAQDETDFEVIVVDNGSTDGSLAKARHAVVDDGRFRFDEAKVNLGFAAGNNRAAATAGAPWLALLNPDAFPGPGWLGALLGATRRHPQAAMFGSTQLQAGDPERLDGAGDRYFCTGLAWRGGHGWPSANLPPEGPVFGPCAAAALYRAEAFRAAGGFDEDFFCYVEDVDLAFRLRLAGHGAIQVPAAVVHHVGGASSTMAGGFAVYHGIRNLVWCFVKNMPDGLFWPLLPLHVATLLLLAMRKTLQGSGDAAWRGLADAITGLPRMWRKRQSIQRSAKVELRELTTILCWNLKACLTREPPNLR